MKFFSCCYIALNDFEYPHSHVYTTRRRVSPNLFFICSFRFDIIISNIYKFLHFIINNNNNIRPSSNVRHEGTKEQSEWNKTGVNGQYFFALYNKSKIAHWMAEKSVRELGHLGTMHSYAGHWRLLWGCLVEKLIKKFY